MYKYIEKIRISQLLITVILFPTSYYFELIAQNILKNPSFESSFNSDKITDWNQIESWECSSSRSGIIKNEFFSPVDGEWIAYQKGGEEKISQKTDYIIKLGESYTLTIWARSINEAGNTAETIADISLSGENILIVSEKINVNAPRLKGVAEKSQNDDGTNVWIDGNFRHKFNDLHMYQSISLDPIKDHWRRVEDNNYEKI